MNDNQPTAENTDLLNEPRVITEDGVEARVVEIIEPIITDLGYRLVRVRTMSQNGLTLQIMVERPDGTVNVSDCEKVSLEISPALDVDDPIDRAYNLEVSSPGIDRPLMRRSDFERWVGHVAKLESSYMVNGRKRFKGLLTGLNGDDLHLKAEDGAEHKLDVTALNEARLVMTDELITDALKRDKALRQANQIDDDIAETDESEPADKMDDVSKH